jgi:hypothetical protein
MIGDQVETRDVELAVKLEDMHHHPVFPMVTNIARLRLFMEWHVFAVWDFMSLVKRLQRDFTCTSVPWLPPSNIRAARLINEIVLGEETDEALNGAHDSHFGLYLAAMREVGASTHQIDYFIDLLRAGTSVDSALRLAGAPKAVQEFVLFTMKTACDAPTHEVLGSFFYGREYSIPKMFRSLLNNWTVDPEAAPTFVYYVKRHIELDSDSHGPAAQAIIDDVIGDDAAQTVDFQKAALLSVEKRIQLWDGLARELKMAGR